MKFGFFGINTGALAEPSAIVRIARSAEEAGFESVWTGEHVVLPEPQVAPSPAPSRTPMLDPAVALAYVAAHTERLRLATGIIILPQRNPVVLAKELASVDVLCEGRLMVGVGAGYLEPEFAAVGAPFADRGARTDEYIDAMRALWSQDAPSFQGRYASFSGVDAHPRPVQKPGPPIVVGGTSPGALRRAVSRGNGWYGFFTDLDHTRQALEGLEKARSEVERPEALGRLEISVTPLPGVDLDTVHRYRELGVDRLTLVSTGRSADEIAAFVEDAGRSLVEAGS